MVSDLHPGARGDRLPLREMLPGSMVDVLLYWHHWAREPASAQRLTQAVKIAAGVLGRRTG
jgi:LysR family transcriptional regulator (chromosome initiation inhibitor)